MVKNSFIKGLNCTLEFKGDELKFKKGILFHKKHFIIVNIKKIKSVEQITKSFFPPLMVSIVLSIILVTIDSLKWLEILRIPLFYKEVITLIFIIGISLGLIMALIRSFFASLKIKLNGQNHTIIIYLVDRKKGKKFVEELVNRLTQASNSL
jgi:hypothetical protein